MEEINSKSINLFKKQYQYNYVVTKTIFDLCGEDNELLFYSTLGVKGKINYIEDYYGIIITEEESLRCYYEAEYELYISKLN